MTERLCFRRRDWHNLPLGACTDGQIAWSLACLPISKYCHTVAIKAALHQLRDLCKHLAL